jgi:hypothetical protein
MGGSLGARNFPWPTTIGGSPNVSPLVSASASDSTPNSPAQIAQPAQPAQQPLAPPNPIKNPVSPITNPIRINPGMKRSFYGM